ncbi:hypothetical protein GCM10010398_10910 [Streptomyces fimbriatus]
MDTRDGQRPLRRRRGLTEPDCGPGPTDAGTAWSGTTRVRSQRESAAMREAGLPTAADRRTTSDEPQPGRTVKGPVNAARPGRRAACTGPVRGGSPGVGEIRLSP